MNIKLTIPFIIAALSAIGFISMGNQAFAQNSGNPQSIPFVVQNTSRSMVDPLPGHQGHQIVIAAPPRTDGKIYSGISTFTASIPVEVVVLHNYTPTNSTSSSSAANNQQYGEPLNAPFGNGKVAISLMKQFTDSPISSGSFVFAGNALAFHNLEGKPFTVSYTIDGKIDSITK
jgi:hypothetical protein